MTAGCEISVSTPPRLSASDISLKRVQHRSRRLDRSDVERDQPAEAAHLLLRQRVMRMVGQAGIDHRLHLGWSRDTRRAPGRWRWCAPCGSAASWCRAGPARNPSARGSRPAAFCTNFIHSTSSWCLRTTMPPTLSLWPLRNFVVLWRTMSAPSVERPLDVGAGERVVDDRRGRRGGARSRSPHGGR